jgi:hypothetical protein
VGDGAVEGVEARLPSVASRPSEQPRAVETAHAAGPSVSSHRALAGRAYLAEPDYAAVTAAHEHRVAADSHLAGSES